MCLLQPLQRGPPPPAGGWEPGDRQCFQPAAPCGTADPAEPTVTLTAGAATAVVLQQNLNHYAPGK